MLRSTHSYIAFCFLSILFVACQTKSEPVAAGPRFHDEPRKLISNALSYADTTTLENQNTIRRLDSFYRVQVRMGFNGSVLIGQNGKVLYERYFGLANRETGQPLQYDNAVQLASISKTFTGAAILYLNEHKYLDINDPVQHYIATFPYPNVTIKMLLSHRSGIPDYVKFVPSYRKDQKTPISNKDVLDMFARYKPGLEFKPGTHFKYCNSNFAVLATVVETVTEMPFPEFMRKYIFDPLGMKHSFIHTAPERLPAGTTISYKYNWVREPDMFADGVYGDKNVYSTVEDMYRWDQSFYHNTLLSNETMELAYGPCSFEKPGIKNYGLGWRMLCFPSGNKIIYHNGWWHGNNTVFYRFIKENMTIVILGNKYNNGNYRQAKVLYSILKNVPVNNGFDEEE